MVQCVSMMWNGGLAMVRTQIQLTDEQARALKAMAAQRRVSMAEVIRDAVERMIAEDDRKEKWRSALAVMGRYRSGLSDVSTNHDKYLAEDYM